MSTPDCPQKYPYIENLEPGDYYWCSCGKSNNQPFCDGSHKGTEFSPVKFTITENDDKYLCGCKQTTDAPFCDGTHNTL